MDSNHAKIAYAHKVLKTYENYDGGLLNSTTKVVFYIIAYLFLGTGVLCTSVVIGKKAVDAEIFTHRITSDEYWQARVKDDFDLIRRYESQSESPQESKNSNLWWVWFLSICLTITILFILKGVLYRFINSSLKEQEDEPLLYNTIEKVVNELDALDMGNLLITNQVSMIISEMICFLETVAPLEEDVDSAKILLERERMICLLDDLRKLNVQYIKQAQEERFLEKLPQ